MKAMGAHQLALIRGVNFRLLTRGGHTAILWPLPKGCNPSDGV